MSKTFDYLEVESGEIAIITINRPDKLNALNSGVIHEMQEALRQLQREKETRCVIITGAGEKAFVAGADIGELKDMSPWEAVKFVEDGQHLMNRLEGSRLPVIAAINGFALGGGCELIMATDIRLASKSAVFGMPEVKLGLIPGFGGTQRLPRLVGKGKAMELILSAETIDADEARRIGLVDEVYEPAKLMEEAKKLAETITKRSPAAVALAKRSIMRSFESSLKEGCSFESVQFGVANSTKDKAEGVAAFMEKRKPNFTGE